jgi:hypothetical protein
MLKENKNLIGEIVSLKLTTAEEIICKIISETDDTFVVNKPLALGPTPNGGAGLFPWIVSGKSSDVMVNKNTVIGFSHTTEDISQKYIESTTNIQIVK